MNMGKIASRRPLLLRFNRARGAIAARLGSCLTCVLLLAGTVHALDPNKRLTQYMHTSWRIQDGSAPSGMSAITQTSDGFLWFLSPSGDLYRFDGVRFHPWRLPADAGSIGKIMNILGDHAGGLWVVGEHEVVHLKAGVVTSRIQLEGADWTANGISEDADGSIWVVRAENGISEPLCHLTERAVTCFGKADGIPISPFDALLPDGNGGFWLGGQTALVHWHSGVSEMYPIEGLKSNAGQPGIISLARGPDGSVWVGIINEGPGLGLAKLEEGAVRSFLTAAFDGSKVNVFPMRFDRDGNLWVGTLSNGVFRVHGKIVEHYARTEGLSSDYVRTLFEDREGIVWAATNTGIDKFHDPRITTFSAVEGLGKDLAVGVLASRDDTIWIANGESFDHIVDGTVSSIRTGAGLPGHQVTSLLEDHAGDLWVGVDDGLYLFKNGHFRRLPESQAAWDDN
jgi:ligand-binding sensor domain-containing protein